MSAQTSERLTLTGVKARNCYRWVEGKMVVEVQLCYRLENVGPKSIPKWSTGGSLDLHDDELGKRFVTKEEFTRIGSGSSYHSVTFWPITEDRPVDKTTVKLVDLLNWTTLLPSFQQAYMLGLGRLPAE